VFVKAQKPQEKDNFRDVCEGCMTTMLEATEGGYEVLAEPKVVAEAPDLKELFREAMKILPNRVRHGIYEAFWEKCERALG